MRARLVVFPIKGRNWAFASKTVDLQSSSSIPSSFKELYKTISSSKPSDKPSGSNVELVIDFFANKMNNAWTKLENAPEGSVKSKIHGLGLKLLSRVKPSENLLKSIPKDAIGVDITYPSSLNARLVRRRLRHVAFRGSVLHKNYFYGSVLLLPVTTFFAILPLPNIPFFWVLFRSYSHWRALKGSKKLMELVSDSSSHKDSSTEDGNISQQVEKKSSNSPWVLQPCEELQKLLERKGGEDTLDESTLEDICERFKLNKTDILKRYQMILLFSGISVL